MQSKLSSVYVAACKRERAECALEFVYALDNNDTEVSLSNRSVQLNDVDVKCIAEALQNTRHSVRALTIEGNTFGLNGLQALLEAIEVNPGIVRELRLGRNKLKDQAAVVIGHVLSRNGCGLRVLDLSENEITKLGVIPIAAALSNETCDIVELSFHNNNIESDAASYLGQAIRQGGRLKHLHLGYNAIRDEGAAQLAKCIPVTVSLSTLDLTANRIGASGGRELARALMTSTCNIQRLNLRHNLFDSETIEMFSEVIARNTSLIQLFLGFMNPAPESAVIVLSALKRNSTMLLLDIYGWKLPPGEAWPLIGSIQKRNNTLMALVTDACQDIADRIDRENDDRDRQGLHPIYVGPDDRDAYMATKSLRRATRMHSRRQSYNASRTAASARNTVASEVATPVGRKTSERPSSRRSSESQPRRSASASKAVHERSSRRELNYSHARPSPTERSQRPYDRAIRSIEAAPNVSYGAQANYQPRDSPYAPVLEPPQWYEEVKALIEGMRREAAVQREEYRTLERRVTALERRNVFTAPSEGVNSLSSRREIVDQRPGVGTRNVSSEEIAHQPRSIMSTPTHNDRGYNVGSLTASRPAGARPASVTTHRSSSAVELYPLGRRPSSRMLLCATDPNMSRLSEMDQRGAPAEYPRLNSLRGDPSQPPAEPVQLPVEIKPHEVVLQTSARPPEVKTMHLGPGPNKDTNPPRRKGSIQYL